MSYDELIQLSVGEAAAKLRAREVTSLDLTRACLDRIERWNPVLNAFITVTAESALQEAARADAEIARAQYRGALHGIPIALKDLIDTAGIRTTAASAVYGDRIPDRDATVVRRLREAGAVFLGKLNLHEFAYGGSGVISHYGPVRNPWDTSRITGGSSSGSAAAVAAGLCYAAIGTDTAGSIRLPASICGITGLKPTYGLVSAAGVIPLCWSYDHVGPMTRTALDAATVLDAIAGYDPEDPTSVRFEFSPVTNSIERLPAGLRLATPSNIFEEDLDPAVERVYREALVQLSKMLGSNPTPSEIPVEGSQVVRVAEPYAYHEHMLEKNAALYQPATLQRIRAGEGIGATKYLEVRRELELLRRRSLSLFENVDVIATPTVPCLPARIDNLLANPAELRPHELRMLRNTRHFNALGWPAITIPCGLAEGLPVGLQLAAAPGKDGLLLQIAHAFEKETGWPSRLPIIPQ
ncbi:MAG: amidase [Terriglobia bacterium]|jgi:aspartyl-tRNA(Asn)/glutamyl-tRNA(Gln) amidotransferase subunit A|nr:amidase [Terriglobia bacterium]